MHACTCNRRWVNNIFWTLVVKYIHADTLIISKHSYWNQFTHIYYTYMHACIYTLCLFCMMRVQKVYLAGLRTWACFVKPNRLRTAIAVVLRGNFDEGWLCPFGLKCSSFSQVNLGTSDRSPCNPYGNQQFTSVKEANILASRNLGQDSNSFSFLPVSYYIS